MCPMSPRSRQGRSSTMGTVGAVVTMAMTDTSMGLATLCPPPQPLLPGPSSQKRAAPLSYNPCSWREATSAQASVVWEGGRGRGQEPQRIWAQRGVGPHAQACSRQAPGDCCSPETGISPPPVGSELCRVLDRAG